MNMVKRIISVGVVVLIFLSNVACYSGETDTKISAEAYALIEAKTEIVLEEKNGDKKMAPASTTKILTAIIAIENAPLTSEFTISKASADVIGSQIGLLEGEKLSLQDLLYLLLLKSANDAAVAIAEGIAGSIDDFAVLMNKKAGQIGAVSSNFVNPHGLPDDNHYTTAKDLAIIAAYAMRNEVFASIVSTKTYKTGYHSLTIANSNKLLYQYDYIKGVKTGFTKAAGRCLVTCAEKEGVMLRLQQIDEDLTKGEVSEAEKAANMLAQLEADMNPNAMRSDSPSVNGMEIMDEDGTVRIVKVGRNDPCPCGSGKKYKRCCGR